MKSCSNLLWPVFLPGIGGMNNRGNNLHKIFLNQSKSLYLLCTSQFNGCMHISYKVYWVDNKLFSEFLGFWIMTFTFLSLSLVFSANLHFISLFWRLETLPRFGCWRLSSWISESIFLFLFYFIVLNIIETYLIFFIQHFLHFPSFFVFFF